MPQFVVFAQVGITDWAAGLIAALIAAVGAIIAALPAIIAALLILLIGWGIGKLIQWLVTKGLRAVHFNELTRRAGINEALDRANIKAGPSAILGIVAYWFVFLIAIQAAVNALGIEALTALMTAIVLYLPRIFAALLILVFGAWAASLLARLTTSSAQAANIGFAQLLGTIVQVTVLFFTFAIALDALGLEFPFLVTAFAVLLGGLALAFAIAFGLGGREYASDVLAGRELRMFFNKGDRITFDGVEASIEDIKPTMTLLKTPRGDMAVQNSQVVNHKPVRQSGGRGGGMSNAA